ncbi:hypothetical protein QUF88_07405 [Bacillus sp. DX1.1]|uniref:hypothetical protein n=1 Tax=unclassified Bacillus (in: firmicutes) TaxID=185979 RepID=UPI002570F208|nr:MULTISPECIES: hypothetical protein [unclassified Bacillus (in: firmicutes)]MDM5153660.1 hypothetical protein [Bacillus sp. DX1.1]WJE82601.1 hypothetical protein QRE67_04910 [Bacillus sp. DX3.1]
MDLLNKVDPQIWGAISPNTNITPTPVPKQEQPTTPKYEQPALPKEQNPPSMYDPKKDSANYDKNGNYKPVDEMKPEEIKEELEGFIEDYVNREQ